MPSAFSRTYPSIWLTTLGVNPLATIERRR